MGHFFLKAVSKSGCEKVCDGFIFRMKFEIHSKNHTHDCVNMLVYKFDTNVHLSEIHDEYEGMT